MRVSPDRETGGGAPHFLCLRQRKRAAPGPKEKRCCPNLTRFGVRFGDAFLSRVPWQIGVVEALGAGPGFAETSGRQPATNCLRVSGCRTDLTFFSPPLPLCPACGSAREAAAERGVIPFVYHLESPSHATVCGTAPPLFPRTTGAPGTNSRHPPHRSQQLPFSAEFSPVGKIPAASGFFSTAAAATFLCQDKEKWGPHPPATGGCTI